MPVCVPLASLQLFDYHEQVVASYSMVPSALPGTIHTVDDQHRGSFDRACIAVFGHTVHVPMCLPLLPLAWVPAHFLEQRHTNKEAYLYMAKQLGKRKEDGAVKECFDNDVGWFRATCMLDSARTLVCTGQHPGGHCYHTAGGHTEQQRDVAMDHGAPTDHHSISAPAKGASHH